MFGVCPSATNFVLSRTNWLQLAFHCDERFLVIFDKVNSFAL